MCAKSGGFLASPSRAVELRLADTSHDVARSGSIDTPEPLVSAIHVVGALGHGRDIRLPNWFLLHAFGSSAIAPVAAMGAEAEMVFSWGIYTLPVYQTLFRPP